MTTVSEVAQKIFSLLKGNKLSIKLFDIDGNETTDPAACRRFFSATPNIMITVNEPDDSNTTGSVEFTKGAAVKGPDVVNLWNNIKRLDPLMNYTLKVLGKTFEPRDFSFDAKKNLNKDNIAMNENAGMAPQNNLMYGKVFNELDYAEGMSAKALTANIPGADLNHVQKALNKLVQDGKVTTSTSTYGETVYSKSMEEAVYESEELDEVSSELLGRYKTAAGKQASAADAAGDYEKGNKRFSGIVKATKKQFANDAKKGKEADALKESFSKMFGSLKTSQQTLENVVIKVRHKTAIDENVRGSRSRHISAIFLECNGERFRFPYNYLPGARAMAQHMAHGGTMSDKVGAYITESVGNLSKLQSFNRYVTTNNLINEDSSGIIETVKENINTIRTEIKKLMGSKTYETVKARLETFERTQLDEGDTDQLKELFTIRRFDEKFEEVLPIVKQLVQEKDTYHKRIEEAANGIVLVRREALSTTPMFEFASENARLGFKLNELALRIVENEELSEFINRIGTKMCKEGSVNQFEKAVLGQVLENIQVENTATTKPKDLTESRELETFFNRFDYKFM